MIKKISLVIGLCLLLFAFGPVRNTLAQGWTLSMQTLNAALANGTVTTATITTANITTGNITTDNETTEVVTASTITHGTATRWAIKDEGSCTMASGTCSAQTLNSTYTTAPTCILTWTGSGTLAGSLKVASTTTTVTPSSSTATDTAVVNFACFGN